MEIKRTSGLLINKDDVGSKCFYEVMEHLERKTQVYAQNDISEIIRFYEEPDIDLILVPRYFPIKEYTPENVKIKDSVKNGKKIKIKHNIIPRDELQKNAIKFIMENKCGTIKQPPGTGKTVIAIYGVCEIGQKTIIIVHRDPLVKQWKNRFLEHSYIKEERIGILKSKNYEEILGKDIIISTSQTFLSLLKRKKYEFIENVEKAGIGILIGDEVHTSVGAPSFSKCSLYIPAKYTFGLSATPERYDKNTDIIEYHLGPITEIEGKGSVMEPDIVMVYFNYDINKGGRGKYLYWGGRFQRARYLNSLIKSEKYMKVCESLLKWSVKRSKDIIFMVDRKNVIHALYDKFNDVESKSKFIEKAELDTLNEQIVFATPGKCKDGVDIPCKDTLIMASPVSNIEQLCGRILRINKGKDTPVFFDMVDLGCKELIRSSLIRLEYYKSKGWKVHHFQNRNGPNIKLSEPEKFINALKEKVYGKK